MGVVERYRMYREANKKLNQKVMEACLDHDGFLRSGRLLGITKGDTVLFRNMEETNVLLDFALNDLTVGGRNAIQRYREEYGGDGVELDILDALLSSYTSLFRVTSISPRENLLLLSDVMNRRADIGLTDIALGETATIGTLLFLRLVSFADFNMTSGLTFAFPAGYEEYLLRKYRRLSRQVKSDSEAVRRFVSFFKLSRTDGFEMEYEEEL